MKEKIRDEFLSAEDLDIRNLSESELHAWWDMWLLQAQATNEYDKDYYSHGVFTLDEPPVKDRNQFVRSPHAGDLGGV